MANRVAVHTPQKLTSGLAHIAPKPAAPEPVSCVPAAATALISLPLEHVHSLCTARAPGDSGLGVRRSLALNTSTSSSSGDGDSFLSEWSQSFTELLNSSALPNAVSAMTEMENTPPLVLKRVDGASSSSQESQQELGVSDNGMLSTPRQQMSTPLSPIQQKQSTPANKLPTPTNRLSTPTNRLSTPDNKLPTPLSPSKKPLKKRPVVLTEIQNSPVKMPHMRDERIEGALALVQLANTPNHA